MRVLRPQRKGEKIYICIEISTVNLQKGLIYFSSLVFEGFLIILGNRLVYIDYVTTDKPWPRIPNDQIPKPGDWDCH